MRGHASAWPPLELLSACGARRVHGLLSGGKFGILIVKWTWPMGVSIPISIIELKRERNDN
eukprot:9482736-Pyramimonas_sp.AAC.1